MELLLKSAICILASPLVLFYLSAAIFQRLRKGAVLRGDLAVLSYSQVIWDDVWQRPQEHAWRTSETQLVLYCAPVQLHNWFWNLGRRYRQLRIYDRDRGRLLVLSPLVLSGHFRNRVIYSINSCLIAFQMRFWLTKADAVYVLSNTPLALLPLQFLLKTKCAAKKRRLVYDVIDDFTAFDWFPDFAKHFHPQMLHLADEVLTGTHQLAKSLRGSTFIPCGVNFNAFSTPVSTPADIAQLPVPVIGYFGTISERIDLEVIAELCDAFPTGSVVLIGPVHFQQSGLPHKPNLHYLGLKPHEEIPGYAQAFSVGLIPFRLTSATMQLHPVKTLEYLAAGVPVVSTALPDVEHFYSGVVEIAYSREEFIKLVRKCIDLKDPDRIAAGVERARNASWEAMTDRMNELLLGSSTSAQEINKPIDYIQPDSHSAESTA